MRKLIICLILSGFGLIAFAKPAKPSVMYVSVQTAYVKAKTSMFSKSLKSLKYGDAVNVIKTEGKWSYISFGSVEGYVASNNLISRKIKASSGFSATTDELALAGKGFSAEVEADYKKTSDADYASVDKMEANAKKVGNLASFIAEGKLKGGEE